MYEAGYPTGASAEAAYYDSGGSRTGWYALAAFVALMALVVGGVLLFQALSSDDQQAEPSQFVLDDYFNRSLAVVTAELTDKGLTFVTVAEENALVPFGFVHRTNPGANEIVLENQEIQVFFNPDPQLQNVPQVVGIPLEEARALLESQGFVIGDVTADETSESGEGTVLSSEPEAGVPVRQGTTVDMVVAAPRSSVQVPVVVGLTQDQAVRLLENPPYEFEVVVEDVSSETIAAGQVMSIAPTQGELVERGGTVTIQASSGAAPIVVPVVEGLTQGDATNQLRNAGFTVEVEFREVTPGSSNDGRVISQTPAAATTMDRGSTVKIVVGQALIAQTTLPPATTPPTTAAPVTDPPVTDPPATTAPATTAPVTVPVTVPPVTDALTGTAATSPP
jgi:beta-lactam-binding protein with PASTA domain